MPNIIIAVDCDLTLVRTDLPWIKWLEETTGVLLQQAKKLDYDLTKYFKEELDALQLTGYEFWDDKNLYDHTTPIEGCVEVLQGFKDLGATVICISKVMGHHGKSKRDFLEKHFPFLDAIYLCGGDEKHLLPCDIIIEDRVQEIKSFTKDTTGIILQTAYLDPVETLCKYHVEEDWAGINNRVVNIIKE